MNRPDAEYFTDGELQEAARKVRQAMLESLPEEDKVPHHFSPAFQEKMGPLLKKAQRMERTRTWKRRTAAAVLVFLLGTGAWLAGDSGARAAVLSWVREVYENSVLYRFFNQGAGSDSLPALRPSYRLRGAPRRAETTCRSKYTESVPKAAPPRPRWPCRASRATSLPLHSLQNPPLPF